MNLNIVQMAKQYNEILNLQYFISDNKQTH